MIVQLKRKNNNLTKQRLELKEQLKNQEEKLNKLDKHIEEMLKVKTEIYEY